MARDSNLNVNLRFLTEKFDRGIKKTQTDLKSFSRRVASIGAAIGGIQISRRFISTLKEGSRYLLELAQRTNELNGRWQEFESQVGLARSNIDNALTPSANKLMEVLGGWSEQIARMDLTHIASGLEDIIGLIGVAGEKTISWYESSVNLFGRLIGRMLGQEVYETLLEDQQRAADNAEARLEALKRQNKKAEEAAKKGVVQTQRFDVGGLGIAEAGSIRALQLMTQEPSLEVDKQQLATLQDMERHLEDIASNGLAAANL